MSKISYYLVGGAVRDSLLNIQSVDNDYVITGATREDLNKMGLIPSVRPHSAQNFPLYYHPLYNPKDLYALARKEQLVNGVLEITENPFITIEEDLGRRDLTINSMAWDRPSNSVIDPFTGINDLKNKTLRATSEMFTLSPHCLMRLALLKARLPDFKIDSLTHDYCISIVRSGKLLYNQEKFEPIIKRILNNSNNHIAIDFLNDIGAMDQLDVLKNKIIEKGK